MHKKIILITCAILLLTATVCAAAETTKFDPKMVAVFKNGLGFVIRTGEANLTEGWGVTDFVPQATLGTFWMSTPAKNAYVDEVVAYTDEVEKKQDAVNLYDLLKANVGKQVVINRSGDLKPIEGEILFVSDKPENALIQIKGTGSATALPLNQIADITIMGEMNRQRSYKENISHIKFKVKNGAAKTPVTMAYLSKGISWVPSYLVNIEDEKKAQITFQGTLVNDLEDMDNVDFRFVVGFPNFQFSDSMSPLTLSQSVSSLVSNLSSPSRSSGGYGGMANVTGQMVSSAYGIGAQYDSVSAGYQTATGTPGQVEEDLFLYQKEGVTLKKGQRAAYTIFLDKVDYEHIYEWEVENTTSVDAYGHRSNDSQSGKVQDAVWHSLRLTNSTNYPWTTGAAFTVSGNKPLAQDTLKYTPKGAKINLKLTIASDVVSSKRETETSRKRGVKLDNQTFDEVIVEGELTIKNWKTKPIKLLVSKKLTGEVVEAADGKVNKIWQGLTGSNPNSRIEWEKTLPAGEEISLKYNYKVYIYPY